MGVGQQRGHLLKLFGVHVTQAFGHVAYHVGSSLTEKRGWRDVDVRLMLPDDEYAVYFGDFPKKLVVWNLAWTALGCDMTGLPVDFQFQDNTLANDEYDGVRSALILTTDDLPLVNVKGAT